MAKTIIFQRKSLILQGWHVFCSNKLIYFYIHIGYVTSFHKGSAFTIERESVRDD
jgi:hypothetical protein